MICQVTWVAESVKYRTLDLNPGLDLRVLSSAPTMSMEPTLKKKGEERRRRI